VLLRGALDMSTLSSGERRVKGDHWATALDTASNATTGTAPTSALTPRLNIGLKLFSPYSKRVFLPAPRARATGRAAKTCEAHHKRRTSSKGYLTGAFYGKHYGRGRPM
jgi:hypothetical protein